MKIHFESIANGLAENGFASVDQFLSQEEVNNILRLKEFTGVRSEFKKAGIGKDHSGQINESIRGDQIHWLDKSSSEPATIVYIDKIESLIKHVNESLFLSVKDFEMHFTIYPAGSFYKRHLDKFKRDDHRKLSVICYLNNDWNEEQGGQLRLHLPGKPLDVWPTSGRLVCFRSDKIEHEVLPTARERLSITGWLLDQFIDLKHL
jgi:SM-20-related protein